MKKLGFPQSSRLHTPAEFKAVFQNPFRSSTHVMTVLACPNGKGVARLGIVVAKRSLPKAVDRNRVRRWIREYFRLSKDKLSGLDSVVVVKSGIGQVQQSQILCRHLEQRWKDILKQWKSMDKKIENGKEMETK